MNIRKAAKVDLDNVLYITSKTIEEVYPRYYPRGAVEFFLSHHSRDNILCDIENDRVYILEVDNMLTGTVTIKDSEICRLFVLTSYQRRGYGRALMDFAENYISKSSMKIQLDASLPAKGIYSNRGYKEVESHSILTKSGDYLCYDVMEKRISNSLEDFNYDGKVFISKENTKNGEVNGETIFTYHQDKNIIWAEYSGGDIIRGSLLGNVSKEGILDFYYQHINKLGKQRIGRCYSIPKVLDNGKLELHEKWQWLNGDKSTGSSIIKEV